MEITPLGERRARRYQVDRLRVHSPEKVDIVTVEQRPIAEVALCYVSDLPRLSAASPVLSGKLPIPSYSDENNVGLDSNGTVALDRTIPLRSWHNVQR